MCSRFKSVARFAGYVLAVVLALFANAPSGRAGEAEVEAGLAAVRRGDVKAGYELLHPEAKAGNARAQYSIGIMYGKGFHVEASSREAIKWYRRAAAGGYGPALYDFGMSYILGIRFKRDVEKAYAYFVAAGDYTWALLALGHIHRPYGIRVLFYGFDRPDAEKSVHYFQRAARLGERDAFHYLYRAYCRGAGVPQDPAEAYKWEALHLMTKGDEAATKKELPLRYWYIDQCPPTKDDKKVSLAAVREAVAAARVLLKTLPEDPTPVSFGLRRGPRPTIREIFNLPKE